MLCRRLTMQVPDTHIIRCASGRQELGGTTNTDAVENLLSKLLQKVEGLDEKVERLAVTGVLPMV